MCYDNNSLSVLEEVVIAKIATTTQHGAIEGKTQSSLTNYYNIII